MSLLEWTVTDELRGLPVADVDVKLFQRDRLLLLSTPRQDHLTLTDRTIMGRPPCDGFGPRCGVDPVGGRMYRR